MPTDDPTSPIAIYHPKRFFLEAAFEDGFVYKQDESDTSRYDKRRNAFFDVYNEVDGRPGPLQKDHGQMVRFSLIGESDRFDVDFSAFPPDAKPILYVKREQKRVMEHFGTPDERMVHQETYDVCYGFGYEYKDPDTGEIEKEVIEVT